MSPCRLPRGTTTRAYHRLLLRQVPAGAQRVLDVGCGAGSLARRLAAVVPQVDAVDRSPDMVAAARRSAPANLALHEADVLSADFPEAAYDAVVSSAVLHHLPLEDALLRMAGVAEAGRRPRRGRPPRVDLPRDLPVELAASAVHHGLGLAFAALRPLTGAHLFRHEATHDAMPVADPR